MNRTNDTVIIAHDYLCPWCWIGFFQAKRLKEEFPQIHQDWRGFELLPESLGPLPDYKRQTPDPNAPPSRLQILLEHEGLKIPEDRTIGAVRTGAALQGAEYFKDKAPGQFDAYNEGVYRAFWEHSRDISDHSVLAEIARAADASADEFAAALTAKTYAPKITDFDDNAYAADITHVPTFVFRGERCAEAPYETIKEIAMRFIAWYGRKE